MGIDVSWDNPECTIIYWHFDKRWDMGDLFAAEQVTTDMLDEMPNNIIDIIINVEESLFWPNNSFAGFKNVLSRITRGNGLKVIVDSNTFLETLFRALSKSNKEFVEGLTFVENLQEARELLSK